MKKRVFTGLMAMVMALSMPITTFAADNTFTEDGSAAIKVSCQVDSNYTVKLPATLILEDAGNNTFTAEATVGVFGNIPGNRRLIVVPTDGELKDGDLTDDAKTKGQNMVTSIQGGYLNSLGAADSYAADIKFRNTENANKTVKGTISQGTVSFKSKYNSRALQPCEETLSESGNNTKAVLSVKVNEPAAYEGTVAYTFTLVEDKEN